MDASLRKMLRNRSLPLWQGTELYTSGPGIPTGFPTLDSLLPDRGWSAGTVLEISYPGPGHGELRLLLPVIAFYTRQQRHAVWIAPPYIPYAPAITQYGVNLDYVSLVQKQTNEQQHYWCMERLLNCPACGVVLLWPKTLPERNVRRLQLAAARGGTLGILLHTSRAHHTSPAATRIYLKSGTYNTIDLTLLKARGLLQPTHIRLPIPL